jgi:hypothetical protein
MERMPSAIIWAAVIVALAILGSTWMRLYLP